jgi:hypothetical protein
MFISSMTFPNAPPQIETRIYLIKSALNPQHSNAARIEFQRARSGTCLRNVKCIRRETMRNAAKAHHRAFRVTAIRPTFHNDDSRDSAA